MIDLSIQVTSEEHLDELLLKYGLKKIVPYQERIGKVLSLLPVELQDLKSSTINKYLGEDLFGPYHLLTSLTANYILNKVYEKENV